MITSETHKDIPATIVHRITGNITAEDSERAVKELLEIMESEIKRNGTINIIINAKGVNFTSLIAHRTWSFGLKSGCDPLKDGINYGIMVLDDNLNGRAEKELMETDRLKFFFDLDDAERWLRNKIEVNSSTT